MAAQRAEIKKRLKEEDEKNTEKFTNAQTQREENIALREHKKWKKDTKQERQNLKFHKPVDAHVQKVAVAMHPEKFIKKPHKNQFKKGKKMIKKAQAQHKLPHLLMQRELGMRSGLKPKQ